MNDELTGQLGWGIPEYAQNALWLETDSEVVQTEGELGLFQLKTPAEILTVRWGHEHGPLLARLRWQVDHLKWNREVTIGGMIEAIHLTTLPVLGTNIAIVHLTGRPVRPGLQPYALPEQRTTSDYQPPDFLDSLEEDLEDTTTTWLVSEDSPLISLAHDALTNNLRVWFGGQLADQDSGWERLFALPLLLETVTLFAH